MTPNTPNPDISVRGGIVNVPLSTTPTHPPRHQPNTPRTKKRTTTKSDHQLYPDDPPTTVKDSPPPAAAHPVPPPDEPETDSPD